LCGADQPRSLPQDTRISVCGNCGFVYVSERRSSAEIAASWGQIYSSGAYDPEWPAVKARLYYVAEWIDQTIGLKGKQLLDIGAGKGQFLREANRRGAHVFGIEPAADNFDGWIRKHGIEDGAIPGDPFDIVTINWTLENCGDCLAMLRFAREHCKPDGWVVVATGSRLLVPFKKPLSKYLNPAVPADLHCFRWSYHSLSHAFQNAGIRGFDHLNPYEECDWMVAAGRPESPNAAPLPYVPDDPKEVMAFFATWERITEGTESTITTWSRK
jgi:SAM-dependent methyltransferase